MPAITRPSSTSNCCIQIGVTNKKSVASDDERHVASIWGGTDPSIGRNGVQYYPDGQTMMRTHIESLKRFIDLGTKAGVDVILSPTLSHAKMPEKMRYWRMANPDHSSGAEAGNRLAGEAHPFVSKEAVSRYNQILLECYEAQLAWRYGLVVRNGVSGRADRQSGVATWIRESVVLYGYPLILFLHTFGLSTLVGLSSACVLSARLRRVRAAVA